MSAWMSKAQKEQLAAMRRSMDVAVDAGKDLPAVINAIPDLIRPWMPGPFAVGNVRIWLGIPYKCVQAHDSAANPAWSPDATPALWMQYHGTTPETARAWIAPTGAHDMYQAGEYMIWTDGTIKRCISSTTYPPDIIPEKWETV